MRKFVVSMACADPEKGIFSNLTIVEVKTGVRKEDDLLEEAKDKAIQEAKTKFAKHSARYMNWPQVIFNAIEI